MRIIITLLLSTFVVFGSQAQRIMFDDFNSIYFTGESGNNVWNSWFAEPDIDINGDGIVNVNEQFKNTEIVQDPDGSSENVLMMELSKGEQSFYSNNQCSNDGEVVETVVDSLDIDGDGIPNSVDIDDDGDGILDITECGPCKTANVNASFETVYGINLEEVADTLPCRAGFYQVINNTSYGKGQLFQFDVVTSTYIPIGLNSGIATNAIGYDPIDKLFYGMSTGSGTDALGNAVAKGDLLKIDAYGETFKISTVVPGKGYYIGEMYDGYLWISNSRTLIKIDVHTGQSVAQMSFSSNIGADMVILDNVMYSLRGGSLKKADFSSVSNGQKVTVSSHSLSSSVNMNGTYGSVWLATNPATDEKELYFSRNNDGLIFRIDDYDTNSPSAVQVGQGTITSSNDGASCADAQAGTSGNQTEYTTTGFKLINESQIGGWQTTSANNLIEIWRNGFLGVPSADGQFFVELVANTAYSSLYQTVCMPGGSTFTWSIKHRGLRGTDVARVKIGSTLETATEQLQMSSPKSEWVEYSGTYTVPSDVDEVYIVFEAISTHGDDITVGNLLDEFSISNVNMVCNLDTDNDGIPDIHDTDADGDGTLDIVEAQDITKIINPSGVDVDQDGLDDAYDSDITSNSLTSSLGLQPVDYDDDGAPDFQDWDSDNNGISDAIDKNGNFNVGCATPLKVDTVCVGNVIDRNVVSTKYSRQMRLDANEEMHYGFKMFLDNSYELETTSNVDIISQWYICKCIGSKVAPISLIIDQDKWKLKLINDNDGNNATYVELGDVVKGEWIDWKFRIILSSSDDGEIQIWRNDVEVYNTSGKNVYADFAFVMKLGIYKPQWYNGSGQVSTTDYKKLYFDKFWAAKESIDDIVEIAPELCGDTLRTSTGLNVWTTTPDSLEGYAFEFQFDNVDVDKTITIPVDSSRINLFNASWLEPKPRNYMVKVRIPGHEIFDGFSKGCIISADNLGNRLIDLDIEKTVSVADRTISCYKVPSTDNFNYLFQVKNVDTDVRNYIQSTSNQLDLLSAAWIESDATYEVKVRIPGHPLQYEYGDAKIIYTDDFSNRITVEDDGKTIGITDFTVSAIDVGSYTYQFMFTNNTTSTVHYVNASTATVDLSEETWLTEYTSYGVQVKVIGHPTMDVYSSYVGEVQTDDLRDRIITDKNRMIIGGEGYDLSAYDAGGSYTYTFKFINSLTGVEDSVTSSSPTINLENEAWLEQIQEYEVYVKVNNHPLMVGYGDKRMVYTDDFRNRIVFEDVKKTIGVEDFKISAYPVNGDYDLRFEFVDINGDGSIYTVQDSVETIDLSELTWLAPNTTYAVRVKTVNHPSQSEYSNITLVYTDDLRNRVINEQKNKIISPSDPLLTAYDLVGDYEYKFRFKNILSGSLYYVNSPTTDVDLKNTTWLESNSIYKVYVRMNNHPNNSVAQYSQKPVTVYTGNFDYGVKPEYYNSVLNSVTGDSIVEAFTVNGGYEYKFRIKDLKEKVIYYVNQQSPVLNMLSLPFIQPNTKYDVRVRMTGHPTFNNYSKVAFINTADFKNRIIEEHEGKILGLDDYILTAYEAEGDYEYKFRFKNGDTGTLHFAESETNSVDLEGLPWITPDNSYQVKVRVVDHPTMGTYSRHTAVVYTAESFGKGLAEFIEEEKVYNPVVNTSFDHSIFLSLDMNEVKSIQLFDMSARAISIKTNADGTVSVPNISQGVYFLTIEMLDGQVYTQKVLKERM